MPETIFSEWYGDVTAEQLNTYRRYNVSPSDHRMIVDMFGYAEDDHTGIVAHVKRHGHGGQYGVKFGYGR